MTSVGTEDELQEMAGDFEPVTASTPKQREVLLEQVKAHVTAELASRQRKRA